MVVIHSLRLCRVLPLELKEVLLPWPPSAYKTCITREMVSNLHKQETKLDSYPPQLPKLVQLKLKTLLKLLQRMTTTLSTPAVLTYRLIMTRSSRLLEDWLELRVATWRELSSSAARERVSRISKRSWSSDYEERALVSRRDPDKRKATSHYIFASVRGILISTPLRAIMYKNWYWMCTKSTRDSVKRCEKSLGWSFRSKRLRL